MHPQAATLGDAAAALAAGEVSAEALVDACLARIAEENDGFNAFLAVDAEAARADARAADVERAAGRLRGPLHGVPLAHKDMFQRPGGAPMTGGTTLFSDVIPADPDGPATVLERLRAAGAITLGTLSLGEFAASPTGRNPHHGDCRNALDPTLVAGGSSSGSAVAVGRGQVLGAFGSDTGGSIRIPAALNGVFGLKPTYGRVSRAGVMPRAFSLDCVGPLARSATDCALLLGAVAGHDARDPTTSSAPTMPSRLPDVAPERWRLAVGAPESLGPVAPAMLEDVERTVERATTVGLRAVRVALPDLARHRTLGDVISKCEAATLHRHAMARAPERYSRLVYERTLAGLHLPASRYIEALCLRGGETRRFLDAVFADDVAALMMPVTTCATPTIAEVRTAEESGDILALIAAFTRLTRPVSYLGLPAVTVPTTAEDGRAGAVQLIGRPWSEPLLLALAQKLASA